MYALWVTPARTVLSTLCATLILVISWSPLALAQDDEVRVEARELARQGVQALEEGRHGEALDLLKQAESKFHAPTHMLYMGRALIGLGQLDEAHRTFVTILIEEIPNYAPPAFHEAKKEAAIEAQGLASRVATLSIEVTGPAPGKATVRIDGQEIERPRLAHPVAVVAGTHQVEASATGFAPASQSAQASVGKNARVELALASSAGHVEPEPERTGPLVGGGAAGGDEGPGGATIAGGVLIGVGAAALVVGAVTGAMTLSRASDIKKTCTGDVCPPEQEPEADDAKVLGNVSTAMFVIGGVAAGAGIVLVAVGVSGDGETASTSPALRLTLRAGTVGFSGRF